MTSFQSGGASVAQLSALLAELTASATRPLDEAVALSPTAYSSTELLALEQDRIFRRSWLCVGRRDELEKPGDYVTFEIGGQPIASILQEDGQVKTVSNVCLHRSAKLLNDKGNCTRIVCPYHAWTYDSTGRLLGAPHMDKAKGFRPKDLQLPAVRTEIWEGWIYVTLDESLPAVEMQLRGLKQRLAMFDMSKLVQIVRKDEIWSTNWKSLAENFMESYHLFQLHATTVEPEMPTKTTVCVEGEAAYCLHYFWGVEGSVISTAHSSKVHVNGDDRRKYYDACIFPSHLIAGGHNFVFWLSLYPVSSSQVHVRWGVAMAPEHLADVTDRKQYICETTDYFALVNREDQTLLENMWGAQHAPLTRPGRLSHFERPLWEFQKFLARSLIPTPGHPA